MSEDKNRCEDCYFYQRFDINTDRYNSFCTVNPPTERDVSVRTHPRRYACSNFLIRKIQLKGRPGDIITRGGPIKRDEFE